MSDAVELVEESLPGAEKLPPRETFSKEDMRWLKARATPKPLRRLLNYVTRGLGKKP